jgi:hypothetical protein
MSFIINFATKNIFFFNFLTNINNIKKKKKYLRYTVTKHANNFSVVALLAKAHRQKTLYSKALSS